MLIRVRIFPVKRRLLVVTANLLMLAGAGCLLVWVWAFFEGALYQHFQRVEFTRSIARRSVPVESAIIEPGTAPARIETVTAPDNSASALRRLPQPSLRNLFGPDPQLVGRLEIPGVHLSVMVRDGVDDDTLRRAAGHLPASALPGQPGDFVLLGHRDTFFRPLRDIQRGDALTMETRAGKFTYIVDSLEVTSPEAIKIQQDEYASATLITCFPFTYIGPAPRRFVVHARLAQRGPMD